MTQSTENSPKELRRYKKDNEVAFIDRELSSDNEKSMRGSVGEPDALTQKSGKELLKRLKVVL